MKLFHELTNGQKIKRWEGVLRVMQNLTPEQKSTEFNISSWASDIKTEEGSVCGTSFCVGGFCGLDPTFKRQGFEMELHLGAVPITIVDSKTGEIIEGVTRGVVDADFNVDPDEFFGAYGTQEVFYNLGIGTSHQAALRAIRKVIADLKKAAKGKSARSRNGVTREPEYVLGKVDYYGIPL